MPRIARVAPGGQVYHVLNRAAGRRRIFASADDYAAFEACLAEAAEHVPGCRVLAWTVMPNHWHLLLWPARGGDLTAFMRKLTLPHAVRWNSAHRRIGQGPVYQGRFKSFIVRDDLHLSWVLRYILRNPVRAGLVKRPEQWRWSSWWHTHPPRTANARKENLAHLLTPPPTPLPADFPDRLSRPETPEELQAVRHSVQRGTPFGPPDWTRQTAQRLGLESTLRPRGRPRKTEEAKPDNASAKRGRKRPN